MIYFDNAATTPVLPCAWDAMQAAPEGNPASIHAAGREAKAALENARATIARCINCDPSEVYFTSGATEACNWAVKSICSTADFRHRSMIASPFEHHAVTEAVAQYDIPRYTKLDLAQMLVNNETGQIYNIKRFRGNVGLLACDMTAAIGHISVNVEELSPDYAMFGGHKFGAPKGIGALIVRDGCPITPLLHGGAQERGERGGTVSVPLACAMAAALEWHTTHMEENITHLIDLRDRLLHRLTESGVAYRVNGGKNVAAHILSLTFPGVYGASLAAALSEWGVMVSTGSACSSGENRASENLIASGLTEEEALSTVRFSFDWQNTPAEADEAAKIIARLIPVFRHG